MERTHPQLSFSGSGVIFHRLVVELQHFKNVVIQQPVDEFLCPTPEMKARDAYVPFLLSKPLNKIDI